MPAQIIWIITGNETLVHHYEPESKQDYAVA